MLCILYVNAVGMLLGIAALLFERTLPATFPRRWVWLAIIPVAIVLPGYYRFHHMVSVLEVQQAVQPLDHAFGMASLTALDPAWWAQIASYDTTINRVWIILSALLVLWGLASALRVTWLVHLARRDRGDAGGSATVDGVPVVVTDSIGPATVGLFRSRVLVPQWVLALPGVQRQYVLRHEDEHRRAHDARLLFVASLPLILMPWNLGMWWLVRRLCLAVEMDCDNRVVSRLGDAPAYGALLLRVAEASSRGPRLQPAFLGGMGSLERRLTALLAPTPLRHVQRLLLPALALGFLAIVVLTPHPVLNHGTHGMKSGTMTTVPSYTSRALPR
jgi:beta-lactamase regulating signal transducer with metallopeptidase domain